MSSSSTRGGHGQRSKADLHVPIRPGTDAALLAGIAHALFEDGLADLGSLAPLVAGVDEVRAAIAEFTPERVASFTGVPAETVSALARELAAAPTAVVYGRIGTHTTAYGTLAAWLVDVLNALTGNLDRPGGAMFPHPAHEKERRKTRGLPASVAGRAACAACPRRWASSRCRRSRTRSRRRARARCARS